MALATLFRQSPRTLRIRAAEPARAVASEMDQLFENLWRGFEHPRLAPRAPVFLPRVDLVETDDEVRVSAELPGLKSEDFHVEFEDGVLCLRGEKRSGAHLENRDRASRDWANRDWHRAERSYGSFERRVMIPVEVEADDAKAVYRDGVLVVTLPKSESARVREIPIDVA